MRTTISKWGNSLGVRIPSDVAKKLGISDGSPVDIEATESGILVKLQAPAELESLLATITPSNLHRGDDWGETVGNEAW